MQVMSSPASSDLHKAALASALRWLARREYARAELAQRLEHAGYPAPLVEDVMDQLVTDGWLSDQRFAESFRRSRSARGYGPVRIRYEMRMRGVPDAMIDAEVAASGRESDDLVRQLYARKYRGIPPASVQERAARTRFLLRRGFAMSQIQPLLGASCESNEPLE
ncbi:MAG: recombination regulator RecX [Pseudomonadota bacterium]